MWRLSVRLVRVWGQRMAAYQSRQELRLRVNEAKSAVARPCGDEGSSPGDHRPERRQVHGPGHRRAVEAGQDGLPGNASMAWEVGTMQAEMRPRRARAARPRGAGSGNLRVRLVPHAACVPCGGTALVQRGLDQPDQIKRTARM